MGDNRNDAVPDHEPANANHTREVRNIDAPDLGGSFEENGQTRRHDGFGAAPGMQPVLPLENQRAAQEEDKDSSAGS
jgi:hypothetical protein